MRRRYLALCCMLLVASLAKRHLSTALPTQTIAPRPLLLELTKSPNAENRFAIGARFPLEKAGMFELELVPGIGDHSAQRILNSPLRTYMSSKLSRYFK